MINAFLSGVLVKFVFPFEWPWTVSFAFGTVISATDPVAVVATLKELGKYTLLSHKVEFVIRNAQ